MPFGPRPPREPPRRSVTQKTGLSRGVPHPQGEIWVMGEWVRAERGREGICNLQPPRDGVWSVVRNGPRLR
eukprot:scaffold130259_cov22-Tisochrysis_lutea.AAC.1